MSVQNNFSAAAQATRQSRGLDDATRRAWLEQKGAYLMTQIMHDLSGEPKAELPAFVVSGGQLHKSSL